MYITCQQCSTIFRLDESLLKTTGSKVRCSQCRNIFIEYPPAPESEETVSGNALAAVTEDVTESPSEAVLDQELEGIDLDELDSILEQGEGENAAIPEDEVAEPVATPVNQAVAELDDADLDMDFDLDFDSESVPLDDSSAEIVEEDTDELDLEMDLEMDFELSSEVPEEGQTSSEPEAISAEVSDDFELDLENMDFSLESDDVEDVAIVDAESPSGEDDGLEELELDLDETPAELELETEEPTIALEDDDELLLDVDETAEASSTTVGEASDDFDLDELDDLLGIDDTDEAVTPEAAATEDVPDLALEDEGEALLDFNDTEDPAPAKADEETDDFDLAELDDMLGGDDSTGQVSAGKSRDVIDDTDELSLDDSTVDEFDTISSSTDVLEDVEDPDGLDMSDLGAMLDDVDGVADEEGEPDLSNLELETTSEDDMALEDLEFELDAEFEDKSIASSDETPSEDIAAKDEEIDLSDIEQMLSGDDEALDTQQLEADFLGLDDDGGEKWAKGEAPELDLDDTDEIDLDEIEAAIDLADADPVEDTIRMGDVVDEELSLDEEGDDGANEELELEDDLVLELESDDDDSEQVSLQEEEDELDLSDLDLGEDQEPSSSGDVIDAGDIELEFQIEDDDPVPESSEELSITAGAQEEKQDFSIEDTVPAPMASTTMSEAEEVLAPMKPKKGGGKGLLYVLIFLLLGGAGYLYYAVAYTGLDIPFINQYLKPTPKDPAGVLRLTTLDINSKFVDSESSGRLFVIEGKVRNGYSDGRQMIRLQGKLFTKGKVLSKTEFAYAGVNISAQDLISLPVAELKKKLNSGIAQGAATKVDAGSSIPFVVVFSELPDELDEFAIEVISSMPAK